jgi:hypothetical protein
MKTFGNEGSAISHHEFLRFISESGCFNLKEICQCEIWDSVSCVDEYSYLVCTSCHWQNFGRYGGAYSPLFGIKQSKKIDLFSVFAIRGIPIFPEYLNLQNLPPSIWFKKLIQFEEGKVFTYSYYIISIYKNLRD